MSAPIELNEAETEAAKRAAWGGGEAEQVVGRIIKAVNAVRLGDPVGTLRRSDEGVVAERKEDAAGRWWQVLTPGTGHVVKLGINFGFEHVTRVGAVDADDWRRIYDPAAEPVKLGTIVANTTFYGYVSDEAAPNVTLTMTLPGGQQRPACIVEELDNEHRDSTWVDRTGGEWRSTAGADWLRLPPFPDAEWGVRIPIGSYGPYREAVAE